MSLPNQNKILRLHAIGPWAGCNNIDDVDLPEDWETMSNKERDEYIETEAERNFWNQGFEWYGEVIDRDSV